jgi:hypothetical protein
LDASVAQASVENQASVMHGQSIEKSSINTLIIKGGAIQVALQGKESETFNLEIAGKAVVNKKKTCLTIYGKEKNIPIRGTIVVPFGTRIIIQGGSVKGTLENIIGSLDIQGGMVDLSGHGRFSKLTIAAGASKIFLHGVMGQTVVHSGQGNIRLGYAMESSEIMDSVILPQKIMAIDRAKEKEHPYKGLGLRLVEPAVRIKIFLSQGQAELLFPKNTTISCTKDVSGVRSFVPNKSKRSNFRVSPYISDPAAGLILRFADDHTITPPLAPTDVL